MSLKRKSSKESSPRSSSFSPSPDETIVPLGTVVRQHGVSKNSCSKWKVDLFQPGGEVFRDVKRVYFFPAPADGRLHARRANDLGAKVCELEFPCEPLGSKWGSAPAIMLTLPEDWHPLKSMVGVLRGDFPQTSDFYICDLLGREFIDSSAPADGAYFVDGIFNASQVSGIESWILKLQSKSSRRTFEVPLQPLIDDREVFKWIRSEDFSKPIPVENLREWLESFTDSGEKPDDQ